VALRTLDADTPPAHWFIGVEVKRDGVFVNVFERNIQTKANISGGTMTGSNERKVSDALITLTNQLTYKVSEIRIHLGASISLSSDTPLIKPPRCMRISLTL
jgi:hypothetical protein